MVLCQIVLVKNNVQCKDDENHPFMMPFMMPLIKNILAMK